MAAYGIKKISQIIIHGKTKKNFSLQRSRFMILKKWFHCNQHVSVKMKIYLALFRVYLLYEITMFMTVFRTIFYDLRFSGATWKIIQFLSPSIRHFSNQFKNMKYRKHYQLTAIISLLFASLLPKIIKFYANHIFFRYIKD